MHYWPVQQKMILLRIDIKSLKIRLGHNSELYHKKHRESIDQSSPSSNKQNPNDHLKKLCSIWQGREMDRKNQTNFKIKVVLEIEWEK